MDVVVTVPKSFGLANWIAEGDPADTEWSGQEWDFYLGIRKPKIEPGERVYVVYNGKLRGYAPLVRIDADWDYIWNIQTNKVSTPMRYSLVRHGEAIAVTIPEPIPGFRGFRYRWWDREIEVPFPDWMIP